MVSEGMESEWAARGASCFASTHWSVVLAAGDPGSPQATQALERLCRTYWYPLYVYVRRKGHSAPDAQDLTQEFITRLLDKNAFAHVQREGGKFRSFLLTALNHFLVSEWEHARAQKRDVQKVAFSLDELDPEKRYQFEPTDEATPETLFERQWAGILLEQALNRLHDDYAREGKADLFQRLQPCLTGAEPMLPYASLAALLGMTQSAVKMAVHRLRKRYGELLRDEIADTVADPQEVEAEIRYLIAVTAR
jgi:RNA polymerase sigma factor (sigma-70 family)